jgi:hypothetical protein
MSQFGDEVGLTQRLARSLSGTLVRAFRPHPMLLKAIPRKSGEAFPGVIATGNPKAKRWLQAALSPVLSIRVALGVPSN